MNINDLPKGSYTPVAPSAQPLNINSLPQGSYAPVAPTPDPSTNRTFLSNVATGVAKGEAATVKTAGTVGQFVANQTGGRVANLLSGKGFTPTTGGLFKSAPGANVYTPGSSSSAKVNKLITPNGAGETVGYGTEKAAEFLAPTGIEEAGATLAGKVLPGIAKSTSIGAKALKLAGKSAVSAVEQGGKAAAGGDNKTGVATTAALGAVAPLAPITLGIAKKGLSTIKGVLNPEVEDALTRAIKPGTNNTRFADDLKLALPHIQETAEKNGTPIKTIDDVATAATQTKKRIWATYANQLSPHANETVDGNSIADAMVSSMDNRFVSQNPKAAQKIVQMAETYRRPIPLGEAEDFLQSANNDLHSYYAKNKVGQQVAKADPTIGHVVAEADALREALYAKLDTLTGKDAGQLKRVYGALTNVQTAAVKRANIAARANPDSLAEQISFAQGAGRILKSAANMDIGDAVAGAGQMAAAKILKDKNTTNGLVEHAFKKLAKRPVLPAGK